MAFATSNLRKSVFGDLKVTVGDWTGAAGDADGNLTVEGGRVYLCRFSDQDSTGSPVQVVPFYVSSTATNTITLGISNRSAVTTGRFIIIHA